MVEKNIKVPYWDVELKTRKSITTIGNYIIENGGEVTDTFNHLDSDIFLLRARMTPELAGEVQKQKGVIVVEKPPRIIGM